MRDSYLGLNQEKVIELQKKFIDGKGKSRIEIEDLILLRRIGDFVLSSKSFTVVIDKQVCHWVKYESIQEDLPMVFPSIKSLKNRVEKLKNIGIISNKIYRVTKELCSEESFKTPGTYSVIFLSEEAKKLFDNPNDKIQGLPGDRVRGYTDKEVKGQPDDRVNKEYQETNTKKVIPTTTGEKELVVVDELFQKAVEEARKIPSVKNPEVYAKGMIANGWIPESEVKRPKQVDTRGENWVNTDDPKLRDEVFKEVHLTQEQEERAIKILIEQGSSATFLAQMKKSPAVYKRSLIAVLGDVN